LKISSVDTSNIYLDFYLLKENPLQTNIDYSPLLDYSLPSIEIVEFNEFQISWPNEDKNELKFCSNSDLCFEKNDFIEEDNRLSEEECKFVCMEILSIF
jgi:hypothetical protein